MGFFDKLFGGSSKSAAPARPEAIAVTTEKGALYAPVAGRVEVTENIPDPVFAQEMMGKTVAIWPSAGVVYAPVSGMIASAMPHAIGLVSDDGVEVLIHVGIDTVSMNGDGFTLWTKQGERVSAGEALLTFDRNKVAKAGYKDIVMTIITNSDDFSTIEKVATDEVAAGAAIIKTA
jgi:glucose-specific phosphotransferase system IIA component